MCAFMHVCVHLFIGVYIYIYICNYLLYDHINMCTCVYIYIYINIYIYIFTCCGFSMYDFIGCRFVPSHSYSITNMKSIYTACARR